MSKLADIERSFAACLQGKQSGIESYVLDDAQLGTQMRLEIYKSAYRIRLTKTIEQDHPVLCTYLGDDLFETLAAGYIESSPSTVTSLRYFCEALPIYLTNTAPFSGIPILAEIAAFERSLMSVFDAPDAEMAESTDLQVIRPDDWPRLSVTFHPSVQLFVTGWNTIESWQAIKKEEAPPAATQMDQQYWLIWRGRDRLTEFHSLQPDGYWFYDALQGGGDLSAACEALMEVVDESEISETTISYLKGWLDSGLIRALSC